MVENQGIEPCPSGCRPDVLAVITNPPMVPVTGLEPACNSFVAKRCSIQLHGYGGASGSRVRLVAPSTQCISVYANAPWRSAEDSNPKPVGPQLLSGQLARHVRHTPKNPIQFSKMVGKVRVELTNSAFTGHYRIVWFHPPWRVGKESNPLHALWRRTNSLYSGPSRPPSYHSAT